LLRVDETGESIYTWWRTIETVSEVGCSRVEVNLWNPRHKYVYQNSKIRKLHEESDENALPALLTYHMISLSFRLMQNNEKHIDVGQPGLTVCVPMIQGNYQRRIPLNKPITYGWKLKNNG